MSSFNAGKSVVTGFPLVCVCIPTYNSAKTIRKTLTSILDQSYPNLVIHVSDNASTDNTLRIINTIIDSRINVHVNIENIGAEENFNRCINLAEGKYTAIYHADDIYEFDMVERQVAYLERSSKTGAVFTAATTIDSKDASTGVIGWSEKPKAEFSEYDFTMLFKEILRRGNFLVCPSAMVRTHIYRDEIKRWRGDLFRSSADLDVWLRIAKKHSVAFISKPLMRYRIDRNQFSNSVRLRTEPADLLLVLDYYLSTLDVIQMTNAKDQRNFYRLVVNDKIWCAINQFCNGNITTAKMLLDGVFSFDALRGSLTSRRGFLMLICSSFLYLMIAVRLKKYGPKFIISVRQIFKK